MLQASFKAPLLFLVIFCRQGESSLEQFCQCLVVSAFAFAANFGFTSLYPILLLGMCRYHIGAFLWAPLRSICRSYGSAARCGGGGAGLVHMWTPNGPHPPYPHRSTGRQLENWPEIGGAEICLNLRLICDFRDVRSLVQ